MKPMTKAEMTDTKANRSLLVLALRNLPDDFKWDYGDSPNCALGLGVYLGLTEEMRADHLATAIGAERDDVHAICFFSARPDQKLTDVTPEQIAVRIERLP